MAGAWFDDLLLPGEELVASFGGPTADGAWIQAAASPHRVFAAWFRDGNGGPPLRRSVVAREETEAWRTTDPPRLEIKGLPQPLVVEDVDHPRRLVEVERFLSLYGRVERTDTTLRLEPEPTLIPLPLPRDAAPSLGLFVAIGLAAGGIAVLLLLVFRS